ncbi:hypothetical protein N7481_008858 [Penicillium waksmanii]|uniref:uncharacterized protein n=1 Tax=Penicillium waksmanii TaxID=69791 RepID=UPI0025497A3C|nr:uncharacterized protein N7481_008858 [Penicillium waksmanii]KAJ5975151.1 hypothetical protein N7481_008858 [Penicillium waksmanii]
MLAPGPAGTSMLGERRGLERQAREHESREEDAFGNENGIGVESLNEDGGGDGLPRAQKQAQKMRYKDSGERGEAQGLQLQFQNESAKSDYSDGPIHSRLERDGDGGKKRGIWGEDCEEVDGGLIWGLRLKFGLWF